MVSQFDDPPRSARIAPAPARGKVCRAARVIAASPGTSEMYHLALKPIPGNWRTPPEVRLRAALKVLLRGYGLRCEALKIAQDDFAHTDISTAPQRLHLGQRSNAPIANLP